MLEVFAGPVAIFCAHTDDETLGCGGLIQLLQERGTEVHVRWFAYGVPPRPSYNDDEVRAIGERREATRHGALAALSLPNERCGYLNNTPPCQLDTVPVLDLTRKIEAFLREIQPVTVLTHWSGDSAQDHRRVTEAVVIATRPKPGQRLRNVLMYETLSNSEWSMAPAFAPSVFVPLTERHVAQKAKALAGFTTELMTWPHPRSTKGVETLATMRGMQIGVDFAEGFQLVRGIDGSP